MKKSLVIGIVVLVIVFLLLVNFTGYDGEEGLGSSFDYYGLFGDSVIDSDNDLDIVDDTGIYRDTLSTSCGNDDDCNKDSSDPYKECIAPSCYVRSCNPNKLCPKGYSCGVFAAPADGQCFKDTDN